VSAVFPVILVFPELLGAVYDDRDTTSLSLSPSRRGGARLSLTRVLLYPWRQMVSAGCDESMRLENVTLEMQDLEGQTGESAGPGEVVTIDLDNGIDARRARKSKRGASEKELAEILDRVRGYAGEEGLEKVEAAYFFAKENHRGQIRASGEPFFTHVVSVTLLAAELELDVDSISAALLHDTIEDCAVEFEDIEQRFGSTVAELVDGVTKLTRIRFKSKEERQAESFRKTLLATARDVRVILLKLCDRLHNMRTLEHQSEEKRYWTSRETEEIYAPIADRLGLYRIKSELEELSLYYLRPEIYHAVRERCEQGPNEEASQTLLNEIRKALSEISERGTLIPHRRSIYSVWRRMRASNLVPDEVDINLGLRIILSSVRSCYALLGELHARWASVPNTFRDYIALPKSNRYQSLHTTIVIDGGHRIEVQLRTAEMDRVAELGICALWKNQERESAHLVEQQYASWMQELLEYQHTLKNSDEFIQSVKGELEPKDVIVFTPKGDMLTLQSGSVVLDFAYAIHTHLGSRCVGARKNGVFVGPEEPLERGDMVEIVTSSSQRPAKRWLSVVKTFRAKKAIREHLKSGERVRAIRSGEAALEQSLFELGTSLGACRADGRLEAALSKVGCRSEQELLAEVGYGKVSQREVAELLTPDSSIVPDGERIPENSCPSATGVAAPDIKNVVFRFGRCCDPVVGERIIGIISKGRSVMVHRAECSAAIECDPLRRVEVTWEPDQKKQSRVWLLVHSKDRRDLLPNLAAAVSACRANITTAELRTTERGKAINLFELEVECTSQLRQLVRSLEKVPSVIKVERVSHLRPFTLE